MGMMEDDDEMLTTGEELHTDHTDEVRPIIKKEQRMRAII